MVKHTQTIRRQIAEELFEYIGPFCGIGAERVKEETSVHVLYRAICKNFQKYFYSELFWATFSEYIREKN